MFAILRGVVKVFLLLDRGCGRFGDGIDASEPFDAPATDRSASIICLLRLSPFQFDSPCPNVAKNNYPQRSAMDLWQRLAVHLPSEHNFVRSNLAPWNGDNIVVNISFLEISIDPDELNVLRAILQATAMLEYLFEANPCPPCSSYCAFAPSVLSISWLLDKGASSYGALISSSPSPGYCWICSILRVPEHCIVTTADCLGKRSSFFKLLSVNRLGTLTMPSISKA